MTVDIEMAENPGNSTQTKKTSTVTGPPKKAPSLASVVKTTMIIKNWLMSVQQEDSEMVDDRMSEINVSLVFEPTIPNSHNSQASSFIDLNTARFGDDEMEDDNELREPVVSNGTQPPALPSTPQANMNSAKLQAMMDSVAPVQPPSVSRWKRFLNALAEIKTFIKEFPTASIDASKSFCYYWTFWLYTLYLYNSVMCVIFVFDNTSGDFYGIWLVANGFADFCYLLDIFICSRIAYMEEGLMVTNLKKMALNYVKSYGFLFDVLSLAPTDLLLLVKPDLSLVRLNRLFKFHRVLDFINKQNIKTNFPNGFRIFHIVIICMILFHFNTALYYKISLYTGTNSTEFTAWEFNYVKIADTVIASCDIWLFDIDENCQYNGIVSSENNDTQFVGPMMNFWEPRSEVLPSSNFTKQYLLSFYWSSMTLTTSGQQPYPTRSAHNFLEIFDTILGVLIFAVIVGSVGNVVATMNRNQTTNQNMVDGLKFYMNYRKVTTVVQKRVMEVVAYNQKYGMMRDEDIMMDALPARLQGELAVHVHMENLKRVRLLRDCEPSLLYELVLKMGMQIFGPHDMICRKGEIAKEMYIVKRGTLEMLLETGQVINRLKEGASFGELAILKLSGSKSANRRNRSLRSVGYSDVYVLKREDVLAVLQDYPEQRNKLIEKAKQMIRQQQQNDAAQQDLTGVDYGDDINDFSAMKNTDETIAGIAKTIATIESEISNMYEEFQIKSSTMKQRVTLLERKYYNNRHKIREINAIRLANQLSTF